MRKNLLILSLVGLTVFAHVSEAMAQRGGRSGGGRSSGARSSGEGGARSYNGGGRSYNGGGRSYYGGGRSYYGGGLGYGSGFGLGFGGGGYYSPYGYGFDGGLGYAPSYSNYGSAYQLAPNYYTTPMAVAPTTQDRDSYYAGPLTQQPANVTVFVPASAQIWFDSSATTQQGTERLFHSPPLDPNHKFSYAIKARWMENGQAVNRVRHVNVEAGQNVTVDFREDPTENLAQPLPRTSDAKSRD